MSVLSVRASAAGPRAEQGLLLTNCLLWRKSVQGLAVGSYNCCFLALFRQPFPAILPVTKVIYNE